jgi:glycosyltransferase involved in cell wall biosynthesis
VKIAILTPGGVDRSGTDRVIPCLLWLIERLVEAGDEVHVFAFSQEAEPGRWPLLGAQVHNAGRWPRSARLARMVVAEHRRAPFDVLHAFWALPSGFVGAILGRLLRRPLLLTLPGGDVTFLPEIGYGSLGRRRDRIRLRIAAAGAKRVTAPSRFVQEQARRAGIEAAVVPLGVALDRWPPRPPRARDLTAPLRLLHAGSLNRVKDQDTLLRAAVLLEERQVPFLLDIVGEDTLGGAVQRRAASLGLEGQVRFHAAVPHLQLRPWMEQSDLLLVSSRHEAGPLVALEAAVAGVPTAGTAVGHIADFAPHAAIAVPVGDAAALAAAIRKIAADEEERLRLAAAAQALALAADADFTSREFRRLYAALCERRDAPRHS